MRVGIYPAAFDPVHAGHLAFAEAAKTTYKLDKIFFLPEPNPRHKQGVKALEHRANMVHLATAGNPALGVVVLDLQEFDIRLVWPRLTARFTGADLYMLIGNNPVKRLSAWPHTAEFGRRAPTFIIARRGPGREELASSLDTLLHTKKLDLTYHILEASYKTYSSPEIRRQIKQGKHPAGLQLPVFEYILQNKLYISGAT